MSICAGKLKLLTVRFCNTPNVKKPLGSFISVYRHFIQQKNAKDTEMVRNICLPEKITEKKGVDISCLQDRRRGYSSSQENAEEYILDKYSEKVHSLCNILQCSEKEVCGLLLKFQFLKKAEASVIQSKVATLLEEGVVKEDLMNDLWILTYSLEKLKDRILLVKRMNFSPIRPWQLRCSLDVLYRLSQNKENNRLALSPHQNLTAYICERLELTEDQIFPFARKHPPVMRVKVAKLKEVIDFLFSEGFNASQIYNTPRILCHSLTTIQRRLSLLRSLNHEPYSLFILCKSQRKFDDFIRSLKAPENK